MESKHQYRLKFVPAALAEWNKLDNSVKEPLRKLLKKRLDGPAYLFDLGGLQDELELLLHNRKPVPELTKRCFGTRYADKGYLSKQLAHTLKQRGLELITQVRRNMKRVVLAAFDQAIYAIDPWLKPFSMN